MTTVYVVHRICAVCGGESDQQKMASTSSWGSPDLDSRPGEPARSSLGLEVEVCPSCAYSAQDVSMAPYGAPAVVESEAYRAAVRDQRASPLAGAFRGMAMILEHAGKRDEAAWALIRSAWACDDGSPADVAAERRAEAAALMMRAHQDAIADAETALVVIDLLRRSGQFDEARLRCASELMHPIPDEVRWAMEYELELIAARDDRAHTFEEGSEARQRKVAGAPYLGREAPDASEKGCPVCGETNGRTMQSCPWCGRWVHLVCSVLHRHDQLIGDSRVSEVP